MWLKKRRKDQRSQQQQGAVRSMLPHAFLYILVQIIEQYMGNGITGTVPGRGAYHRVMTLSNNWRKSFEHKWFQISKKLTHLVSALYWIPHNLTLKTETAEELNCYVISRHPRVTRHLYLTVTRAWSERPFQAAISLKCCEVACWLLLAAVCGTIAPAQKCQSSCSRSRLIYRDPTEVPVSAS